MNRPSGNGKSWIDRYRGDCGVGMRAGAHSHTIITTVHTTSIASPTPGFHIVLGKQSSWHYQSILIAVGRMVCPNAV
jgi:hypothetical protein